ncbi:DUF6233 domain-containing protein [Streptomyces rishiriensis]|uniref:DUF6233 domain-containing protein n=1 Tax=Streptomyces rishiriensis TaxID=68264 RepID=UPI0037BCA73C
MDGSTAIAVALARIAADRRLIRVRFMIETPFWPGPSRPVTAELPDKPSGNLCCTGVERALPRKEGMSLAVLHPSMWSLCGRRIRKEPGSGIAAVQQRQAEAERGRIRPPEPPQWTVELGIGTGRPPVQMHGGDCRTAGKRRRPLGRDEARRLLAGGLRPCTHCRPDTQLDTGPIRPGRSG